MGNGTLALIMRYAHIHGGDERLSVQEKQIACFPANLARRCLSHSIEQRLETSLCRRAIRRVLGLTGRG